MRMYLTVGLVVVVAGLAFFVGLHMGRRSQVAGNVPGQVSCSTQDGSCCSLPLNPAAKTAPKLHIPTGSGRSCLVVLEAGESAACREMAKVLAEVAPQLKGRVEVVKVDTGLYPGEAQRWRPRQVPTLILVDTGGKELWRHEGLIEAGTLLTRVTDLDNKPTTASKHP